MRNQRNLIPLLIELANSQECRNLRRALASSRQTSEGGNRIDRRRSPRWHGEYLKLLSFNGARLRARDRCGDSNCLRTKLVVIRGTSSEKDPDERDGGEMANSAGRDREKSLPNSNACSSRTKTRINNESAPNVGSKCRPESSRARSPDRDQREARSPRSTWRGRSELRT